LGFNSQSFFLHFSPLFSYTFFFYFQYNIQLENGWIFVRMCG
jgi:hypothetical protein